MSIIDLCGSESLAIVAVLALLKDRQTRLGFAGVSEVKAKLDRYGITDLMGNENFFVTVQEFANAYQLEADSSVQ